MSATQREVNEAVDQATRNERNVDTSFTNYVNSTDATVESLKDLKNGIKSSKQALEESSAESQAAEITQQEVLSVSDALKLIDEENDARAQYRKQAGEYMATSAKALSDTVTSGMRVIGATTDDLLGSLFDKSGKSDNEKSNKLFGGVAATGLAAGVAMSLLPGGTLRDTATNLIGDYMNLNDNNEVDDGVEYKAIENQENVDEYATDVTKQVTQDGKEYDTGAVGKETDQTKEVKAGEGYKEAVTDEATETTEAQFEEMSKIGNTIRENVHSAIQATPGVADILNKDDNSLMAGVAHGALSAVASFTGLDSADVLEKGAKSILDAAKDRLEAAQQEREDAEKENENGGSGYGY